MKSDKRPLSPHIQVYKPQITSITSIMHRITGIILYIGTIAICAAITYYTYQINTMAEGDYLQCGCFWKKAARYTLYLIIAGWAFSLYYHLCNGIRHLFWDIGKGFEIKTANKTGILVLGISLLMTLASIFYIILVKIN